MTETINCDMGRVVMGIEMLNNDDVDAERLEVWKTDCVLRGVSTDEMIERNCTYSAEQIAIIEKEVPGTYKFKFHQNQLDSGTEFTFRPPGTKEIAPDYAPDPDELGDDLFRVVAEIENEFGDVIWDFAGVEAASIANGGYFTDFEFEYEFIVP